ncbi:N-6 DNA methylase [Streptomyces avicenniae]|uniref:N-6 DNA methylase n=1 Tax=Streptomyces avicenniae TaxID=500153 RepID=UPI00069BD56C|nr:N-6 DNA methylase [Streptomyces avicenniae]
MPGHNSEVTAAGIARLAGVGRAAVSNWRRRHDHFPRPVGGTETSPTFALPEVERWLRAHGKLADVPLRERLWQLVESGHDGVAETVARLGDQLLQHGDRAPEGGGEQADATAALAATTSPAETFEFLLGRHLDAAARQLTLTPPDVAALMAALAGPADSVYDPACGPGTLLAAARTADGAPPPELHGQDADPLLTRLCGLRLALRGSHSVHVHPGDTLLADAFPMLTTDIVLCHPPFNERHWGHAELSYDTRWEYGLPARAESELAWLQHALARLRPGGTAVVLMPPAVAARRTGRRLRAALLRRGTLRAVIALPTGAAPPQSLPLHLWVLRKPDPAAPAASEPRLLVVETGNVTSRTPGTRAGDGLDWPALRETVLTAWDTFRRDGDLPLLPGIHRALSVIDLLDDEVDLTPARHLPPPGHTTAAGALTGVRRDLQDTLRRTLDLAPVPEPRGELPAGAPHWPTVTVGELARAGALELHPTDPPPTRPGDVLVPLLHDGTTTPGVVADSDAGATLERHTGLLRPDPAALDPWFLAGFLRGSANTRQASSYASAAGRVDLRRLKVPRLPLALQRRYGRRFAELAAFETALGEAAELGRRLAQGTVDGLTEGTLPPGDGAG